MVYIDDILLLGIGILSQNIDQLRSIFATLRTAGHKFNAHKRIFGLNNIPYIGYIIIWKGIKPDQKNYKVSWISGYLPPRGEIMGMVQDHR